MKPSETPDQQQNRDRHAKKPQQQITSHFHLRPVIGLLTHARNFGSWPSRPTQPLLPTGHADEGLPPLLVVRPPGRASPVAGSWGDASALGARAWKSSPSSSSTASRSVRSTVSLPSATRWYSASSAW